MTKIEDKVKPISSEKISITSVYCRICYDNEKSEDLIAPCECKGTVAFVHCSCLEAWLAESATTHCELCHHFFNTERVPKYTACKSIWQWLKHGPKYPGLSMKQDVIAWLIVTPLAITVTYICLYSSEYYSQAKFSHLPAARWTSISLLLMIIIMLFGYYLWFYNAIRLYVRMWYNWWQRSCTVRYIPPSVDSLQTTTANNNDDHEGMIIVPNNTSQHLEDANDEQEKEVFSTESNESTVIINLETMPSSLENQEGNHNDDVAIDMENVVCEKK